MAITVHVAGLASIKVNLSADYRVLSTLGYTQDGATIVFRPYYQDVPGDENGGDAGPPIDRVYMGEVAQVQLELTKWDDTLAALLIKRFRDPTALLTTGQPAGAGTLTFSTAHSLVVSSPNGIHNFPRAVLDGELQINKGTKYSRWLLGFTCYKNTSGVLWTTDETVLVP
jgi:hypothetical protein